MTSGFCLHFSDFQNSTLFFFYSFIGSRRADAFLCPLSGRIIAWPDEPGQFLNDGAAENILSVIHGMDRRRDGLVVLLQQIPLHTDLKSLDDIFII